MKRKRDNRRKSILAFVLMLAICEISFLLGNEDAKEGYSSENYSKENYSSENESIEVAAELQVHFLDVGQGDCTLITCGEHAMLIDAGDNSQGTAVQLYLEKRGIDQLDYVIGTHPDADHIGGMDVIITKFDCGRIILPDVSKDTQSYRDVLDAMDYRGYESTISVVGDTYCLGEATFTIVAPNGDYEDTNNYSVGIKLVYGENSFLFTGDAEAVSEEDMLQNGLDLSADVLKIAHHGSNSSTTWEFLQTVNPVYGVISCGIDNEYGHPAAETLNTLRSAGIKVFRTDEQGSIVAVSDGKSITFNCAPSDSWKAGE